MYYVAKNQLVCYIFKESFVIDQLSSFGILVSLLFAISVATCSTYGCEEPRLWPLGESRLHHGA